MRSSLWSGILLLLLLSSPCFAQSKKISVALNHVGEDSVGQALAFALKEAIRASQAFVLVDNDPQKTRITAMLSSVEGYSEKGVSTALGYSIVYDSVAVPGAGILFTGGVLSCGREKIQTCAKGILVQIDRALDRFRINVPILWKTL